MKKKGAILFVMMLFAASVFASTPGLVGKKMCHCPKAHGKCLIDSLAKVKNTCTMKKVDIQAKKVAKDEPKSIFSGLFSFDFPTSSVEDFLLSAQKALIEKFS
jgi:hypothetical protein